MSDTNKSDVTTEIDIDSISSACSSWDSSISSVNIDSNGFKTKFSALNANGVGQECVNSIAKSLEQMSSLVSSISGFLKSNLNNQTSVDDSLLISANDTSELLNLLPSDQVGLNNYGNGSRKNSGSSSYMDDSYGDSSSVSNNGKNLNVNTGNTNSKELSNQFINEVAASLESVAKNNNITVEQILNDKKYSNILNSTLANVASKYSLSLNDLSDVGINAIKKALSSMYSSNSISEFSQNIIYNYVSNIASFNNMSTSEVLKDYSSYFHCIASDLDSVVNNKVSVLDVYDGKNISPLSSYGVTFIRDVVNSVASVSNTTPEAVISDPDNLIFINEKLKELSMGFKSL